MLRHLFLMKAIYFLVCLQMKNCARLPKGLRYKINSIKNIDIGNNFLRIIRTHLGLYWWKNCPFVRDLDIATWTLKSRWQVLFWCPVVEFFITVLGSFWSSFVLCRSPIQRLSGYFGSKKTNVRPQTRIYREKWVRILVN